MYVEFELERTTVQAMAWAAIAFRLMRLMDGCNPRAEKPRNRVPGEMRTRRRAERREEERRGKRPAFSLTAAKWLLALMPVPASHPLAVLGYFSIIRHRISPDIVCAFTIYCRPLKILRITSVFINS